MSISLRQGKLLLEVLMVKVPPKYPKLVAFGISLAVETSSKSTTRISKILSFVLNLSLRESSGGWGDKDGGTDVPDELSEEMVF